MGFKLEDGIKEMSLGNDVNYVADFLCSEYANVALDLRVWFLDELDKDCSLVNAIAEGVYDGYTWLEWTADALENLMEYYWDNGSDIIDLKISSPNIYWDAEEEELEHPYGSYNRKSKKASKKPAKKKQPGRR